MLSLICFAVGAAGGFYATRALAMVKALMAKVPPTK